MFVQMTRPPLEIIPIDLGTKACFAHHRWTAVKRAVHGPPRENPGDVTVFFPNGDGDGGSYTTMSPEQLNKWVDALEAKDIGR